MGSSEVNSSPERMGAGRGRGQQTGRPSAGCGFRAGPVILSLLRHGLLALAPTITHAIIAAIWIGMTI